MGAESGIHQQIVESSLDGLWVIDARGRTVFANRRVAELLGRTEDEVAAISLPEVLDESDRSCFEAHLAELIEGKVERRAVERTFCRPDGTPVPLVVSEQVLYDDDQLVVGYVYRLTEDGRRRALVDELSRSQSQLAEAQTIARIGSWEIQVDPREVTWSAQMYALLDVDPETFDAGPEGFFARVVDEDRAMVEAAWADLGVDGEERIIDCRLQLSDGSSRWVRALGRALEWTADGVPVRFGGTVQDIDDLKEAELKLLDAVEVNTVMQFMASAANETNTLDEALERTRELLLAHPDWARGVAGEVFEDGVVFRPVGPDEWIPATPLERVVA